MRRARDESGQVIVLTALFLPVMLILLGFVVDYGASLVLQRKAQAAADATALAAVWAIPSGAAAVQGAAADVASKNGSAGLDTTNREVTQVTTAAPGDGVHVKVSGCWSTVFARVFGVTSVGVSAAATAAAQSVLGCGIQGCDVVPWGIPDCATSGGTTDCSQPLKVSLGQRVTLKSSNGTSGSFYAISDPQLASSSCGEPSGAGDYSNAIVASWASGGVLTCNVRATGGPTSGYSTAGCDHRSDPSQPTCVVQVKTGNMVGPTAKGLESRLGCTSSGACNADTLSYITGGCDPTTSPGHFCAVIHKSPRLVVVPIVRNLDNSAGYANCGGSGMNCYVKVIDLVYFYVDATYGQIDGGTVTGTFFRSTTPPSFDLVGPYNGGTFVRARLVN